MNKDYSIIGLSQIHEREAIYVIGGIDKEAQNVLYLIGYAIGVICKFISKIFKGI